MKRIISASVADLCVVLWAALPTFLLIELLLPGFISQLIDLTTLLIVSLSALGVVLLANIPIALSAAKRWYLIVIAFLDLLLVGYHISLQVSDFLLALAVSAIIGVTIFSALYTYYDRRSQH